MMNKVPKHQFIDIGKKRLPVWITKQYRNKNDTGFEMHWHEAIEFYFVLQGAVEVFCNKEREWLYEGDTGYIGWCEVHNGMDFLDGTTFLTVQIDLTAFEYGEDEENPFIDVYKHVPTFIKNDEQLRRIAQQLQTLNARDDEASYYRVKGVIYQLIGYLLEIRTQNNQHQLVGNKQSEKLVREVVRYITYHFNEHLSLMQLSKEIGVTPQHLSMIFKKQSGLTLHQYINKYRCYRALTHMVNGMTFSQAAFEVGYNDYNYFSRAFKKVFGMSPRNYIEGMQVYKKREK